MMTITSERLVRIACFLGLIALCLMVWSVVQPTVWPVLVALSVGQIIGTFSFLLYLVAILRDTRILKRLRGRK